MPDFIPLTTTPQQTPGPQFYDSQSLAQLQADQMQLEQRQRLAQALLGGNYVPNSGRAGALTSILGSVVGAFQQHRNNESVTDLLRRKFDAENQAAQAKHQQDQADLTFKTNEEIRKAVEAEKARKMYAPTQFQDHGAFEPSDGSYRPLAAAAQQEVGIKSAEADATARANARYRAGPADPFSENWAANAVGDPRIKQFEANRKAAVDELTRVYRGTGGSEADIKTWADALSTADSPQQLQGTIAKISELLNSKISALGDQYTKGMGTIAGQQDFVSPAAHSALERIAKRSGMNVAPPTQQGQQGQLSDADLLRKYGGM